MRGSIGRQYIDWIKNNMEMLGICHSFLQLLQRFKRAQRVGIDRLQCKAATDCAACSTIRRMLSVSSGRVAAFPQGKDHAGTLTANLPGAECDLAFQG